MASKDRTVVDKKDSKTCKSSPHSLWVACSTSYINLISRFFALLGTAIARRPFTVLALCCCFVGVCAIGIVFMKTENRAEKLFIPQDSRAIQDMNKAEKHFGMDSRIERVIFLPKAPAHNLLSKECLSDVLAVHREVISIQGYKDLCLSRPAQPGSPPLCLFLTPVELLNFSESNFPNATLKIEGIYRDRGIRMRNGRPLWYNIGALFGGLELDRVTGRITHVGALQATYFMKTSEKDQGKVISEWEKKFLERIDALKGQLSCTDVVATAQRSLDDAIGESTAADMGFISVTYGLMIMFACLMLGKFRNPLMGHSLLSNVGIFSVFLGILAGLGFGMLVQTPFISMVGALPFLVVGIGIDDMFIMVDELDRVARPQLGVVETIKMVMANVGPTITMTTMTDLVAFAVSTWSELPAIQYFCLYAAVTIFFAYLMIVVFFVAMMTLDVRRVKARRRDCFPFCHVPPPKEGAPAWDEPQSQSASKVLSMWGTFLMRTEIKCIVVVISLVLCGAGIYGALNISEEFDAKLLAKDGATYLRFVQMEEKYFTRNFQINVILDEPVNYTSLGTQKEILGLSKIISENKFYTNATISWMEALKLFSKKTHLGTEGRNFIPTLKKFLKTPTFTHFMEDLRFSEDGHVLEASRILCFIDTSLNSIGQRDAMVTLRKDLDNNTPLPVYAIAKPFVYFEQYAITFKATVRNLAIASSAILVITSPFLVNLRVTFLVFFGFVALIFELFGLMYVWGVSLHGVSMINLVMAIGFAVDYSAHIAHAYVMSSKKTAEEKVVEALRTLGASVLMGGGSTFIGMIMLAFASSEIFRIFFKMFFGIVFLGLLHGLCFLPVYLSVFCRPYSICDDNTGNPAAQETENQGLNRQLQNTKEVEFVVKNGGHLVDGRNSDTGANSPLLDANIKSDSDKETVL